jgi:hypothetical protein
MSDLRVLLSVDNEFPKPQAAPVTAH